MNVYVKKDVYIDINCTTAVHTNLCHFHFANFNLV